MLVLKVEKDDLTHKQYEEAKDAAYDMIEFAGMLFFYLLHKSEVTSFARVQIVNATIIKSESNYDIDYCKIYEEVKRARNSKAESDDGSANTSSTEIAWPGQPGGLPEVQDSSSPDVG